MTTSPSARPTVCAALAGLLLALPLPGCHDGGAAEPGGGLIVLPPAAIPILAPDLDGPERDDFALRPSFHDFGEVPLGEVTEHVFRVKNTDPGPITITRLQPACVCTQPVVSYTTTEGEVVKGKTGVRQGEIITIPPGVEAEIRVGIDTTAIEQVYHNVDKLYTVSVATDSTKNRFFTLEMHVKVVTAFQVAPKTIDLGRVPWSAGGRGSTDIIRVGESGASIIGVSNASEDLEVAIRADSRLGRDFWAVEVTLLPPLERGLAKRRVELLTETPDGQPARPVTIPVQAYVVDDIDWDPRRFFLRRAGAPEAPDRIELDLYSLVEGQRFRVTGGAIEAEDEGNLELSWFPLFADANGKSERWTARLSILRPPRSGAYEGYATFELDNPDQPEVRIRYQVLAN
ncbi:MAG: DUF1573 domain-containing protein [Planctomycetota bacterium]|nr:DUF1573 domain-containing protein [Planctomycetota bacterium]